MGNYGHRHQWSARGLALSCSVYLRGAFMLFLWAADLDALRYARALVVGSEGTRHRCGAASVVENVFAGLALSRLCVRMVPVSATWYDERAH